VRYTRQTGTSAELFIGILGHDIRNPLGTILVSAAGLVRSGKLTATAAAPINNAAARIKAIIEQVGGELTIDSTPEAGTTFSVSLPRQGAA